MSLGVVLLLCSFSRIIALGFPIEPMTSPLSDSWSDTGSILGNRPLTSNKKVGGYSGIIIKSKAGAIYFF